ncbi:aminoacyl tRNA synthase complex-interacting multifunctional protein 2 isoform X1 [Lepisosteus oculatus]|uniref:aminoacyl tRNA synthase complex-interacting multifunctional protein 2 isoform X1 n=1 Tax=Lepisosteus oculatus TaxID=7918 RepID=UPI0035F51DDA
MPMYQVKPISGGDIQIDLPTCMYTLANIHDQRSGCAQAHQDGEADPAVRALEARQDEILRRLLELKAAVEGLSKAIATPDADVDVTSVSRDVGHAPGAGAAGLDSLLGKDNGALRDIVVNANPTRPPLALLVLHSLLRQRYRVLSTAHVHSSVPSVPPGLLACLGPRDPVSCSRHDFQLGFTLIWKDVPKPQMKFSIQNMCHIEGEGNIARFLYRLLGCGPQDAVMATVVDSWVDTAFFQLVEGSSKEKAATLRALNGALGRSPWLAGSELSLADIVCFCAVLQSASTSSVPTNVQKWIKSCENSGYFTCVSQLMRSP